MSAMTTTAAMIPIMRPVFFFWRLRGARGALELTLSIVALPSLLTVALRLPVAADDGHLLGGLLPVAAGLVATLLGGSTLLGLVGLLILRRIGRAHQVLPCW